MNMFQSHDIKAIAFTYQIKIKLLPEIADACNGDELSRKEQEKTINCNNRYENVVKCEKDLLCFKF